MKKTYYYAITSIIILWIIMAIVINNSIVLPSPFDVLKALVLLIINYKTWIIILMTLFRVIIALIISFFFSLLFATIAFKNEKFKDFFHVIYVILKTIPNIAIIIISLIWFGREGSIILIVFLVTFPIMYSSIMYGYLNIDHSLILNTNTYEDNFMLKWKKIYLPLIRSNILEALKNTLSLGLKVTVMSELLAQVKVGIGKELYFYKINLEMVEIFAWTIIMIVVASIFDYLLNKIIDKFDI